MQTMGPTTDMYRASDDEALPAYPACALASTRPEGRTQRAVDRDLELAGLIQRSLLPKSKPKAAGFEIAGWTRPADSTGGDYYDWLGLADGRVAFSVADAAGHGIGPALMVTACRAYFRACWRLGETLEDTVLRINDLLTEDLCSGRFITAAVGTLDPRTGELRLYSAGHAPLLYYNATEDRIEEWGADDIPLGIVSRDEIHAHPRQVEMAAGDTLLIVTDGFLEAKGRHGERYGIDRLRASFLASAGSGAEGILDELRYDLEAFTRGEPQGDDLTALVVGRA
jgi:phosphoserine phosphatase